MKLRAHRLTVLAALLAVSTLLSCKGRKVDPESIRAAADSALKDGWSSATTAAKSIHSAVYDSLDRYYFSAHRIEQERLSIEDSLKSFATRFTKEGGAEVDSERLKAEKLITNLQTKSDSLQRQLVSLEKSSASYFDHLEKSLLKEIDPAVRMKLRAVVLDPLRFSPFWRSNYDSLGHRASELF